MLRKNVDSSLKSCVLHALQNYIDHFPFYKLKIGKKRAQQYQSMVAGFDDEIALAKKIADDISEPHRGPLGNSVTLRDILMQILMGYLKIDKTRDVLPRVGKEISQISTPYTNIGPALPQIERRVTYKIIHQKLHYHKMNVEMVTFSPRNG